MPENISVDNQLFNWESWDIIDTMVFYFYDVTLNVPIGQFAIGTKFEGAFLSYEDSVLELQTHANDELSWHKFKLTITATPISEKKIT
jgi:hypothetical protein